MYHRFIDYILEGHVSQDVYQVANVLPVKKKNVLFFCFDFHFVSHILGDPERLG